MTLAGLLALSCPVATSSTTSITFRGGVLHAPPFATVEEQEGGSYLYGGIQADLLERIQILAAEEAIDLTFELNPAPPQYGPAFNLVANDCNTTDNPNPLEECDRFDMIVANFYTTPERSMRTELSPAWLRSTLSTIKYLDKKFTQDYTTMKQVADADGTVCLKGGTYYETLVRQKFPGMNFLNCDTQDVCLELLKAENCALYASDELQLRYRAANDATLEVTPESFNTQYIAWALKDDTPNTRWLKRWIYQAIADTTMDQLYFKYFQKELCPVGTAGETCELPCNPDHGEADERGVCVCTSTKWTGPDCSTEVPEEKNLIPTSLKIMAYCMVGWNCVAIFVLACWLFWKRRSTQVRISQPFFLCLILLGCLISTLTIVAMAQEDEDDGDVPACMAIPWFYSVGFSVTFGSLFAKIRRVYLIFKSAAELRRHTITIKETIGATAAVLLLDVIILTVWTIVDPLQWERTVSRSDKFGEPLDSEGFCSSDSWQVWVGLISLLHLFVLGVACFLCYVSRDIPTQFSEGKYVSIAMFSNLQIYVVAVPILVILGSDPESSFFVRSVVIWMNDFVVITLIFGNLIHHVHFTQRERTRSSIQVMHTAIGNAIQTFHMAQTERSERSRRSFPDLTSRASVRTNGSVPGMDNTMEGIEEATEASGQLKALDPSEALTLEASEALTPVKMDGEESSDTSSTRETS